MDDKLLTPDQVANKLQLHPRTVRRYIREKKLQAIRFGRALRIRQSELDRFLKDKETTND